MNSLSWLLYFADVIPSIGITIFILSITAMIGVAITVIPYVMLIAEFGGAQSPGEANFIRAKIRELLNKKLDKIIENDPDDGVSKK